MTPFVANEAAQRRNANFFRDTKMASDRQPEAAASTEHLEAVALASVKTNLEAHAQSLGRTLEGAQLATMLTVAQSYLRRLPREQLQGFNSSSALMSSITQSSYAGIPATDAKAAAMLAAAQGQTGNADPSNIIAGRFRDGIERATLNSSQRFAAMASEGFSQADTAKIAAAMGAAREYGMTWMNPRDLLSIGAAGVKAIAETNLKEAGYKALREGSFYEAKDIVAFAKHSKLRGFDAEKAAHATKDIIQAQPTDQQRPLAEIFKTFDHAAAASYANPADPAARQRLEEAGQRQKAALQAIADRSAADAERVRVFQETKKIKAEWQANATTHKATAEVKVAQTEVKVVKADAAVAASLDGLDEPQPKKVDGQPAAPAAAGTAAAAKPAAAKLPAPKQ